jgi:CheY-like chemotaxis protein
VSGFHFVIAEDDSIARLAIITLLSLAYPGCRLTETGDGAEALAACLASQISLLITNHHMVALSGIELIEAVRSHGLTTPILMVTGDASIEPVARAAGADAVILKPFALADVGAAVAALLNPPNARAVSDG